MIKLKMTKRKLNKEAYEIIKNIEILAFIKQKNLKNYINFIIKKIEKVENSSKFISYLKKIWFNKNPDLYNYEKLLNIIKNVKIEDDKVLDKFFATNNISESLHRKINYYLPKNYTTAENFCKAIKKLFLDNLIKQTNISRNDYKTRAIIDIISDMKLNEEPKWIDIKLFKDYQLKEISKKKIK